MLTPDASGALRAAVRARLHAAVTPAAGTPAMFLRDIAANSIEVDAAGGLDALTAQIVEHIEQCVSVFCAPDLRAAVLARGTVAERWQLWEAPCEAIRWPGACASPTANRHPADVYHLPSIQLGLDATTGALLLAGAIGEAHRRHGLWPGEAAPSEVAMWARRGADSLTPADPAIASLGAALVEQAAGGVPDVLRWLDGQRVRRLPPYALALLFLAEREVEADRRRASIAWDTRKESHMFTRELSKMDRSANVSLAQRGGSIFLTMPDDGPGMQLFLPAVDGLSRAVTRALAHDIRHFRKGEGLRHWIAWMHLLSTEGRKGWMRYTVDAHLDALGIVRGQWRRKRESAIAAMGLFTRIKLTWDDGEGSRITRPLVLVGEERTSKSDDAWGLEGMILRINPLLYSGVRQFEDDGEPGALGRDWYPVPVSLAHLNPKNELHAMILGAELPYRFRWDAGDGEETLRLSGRSLLDAADIDPQDARRHPAEAWGRADHALDKLRQIGSLERWAWDADGARSLAGMVTIQAPAWAGDRVIRKVPPTLERPPQARPLTGGELRAWRKARGWRQADLAERLSVARFTILRAEKAADAKLGRALLDALDAIRS